MGSLKYDHNKKLITLRGLRCVLYVIILNLFRQKKVEGRKQGFCLNITKTSLKITVLTTRDSGNTTSLKWQLNKLPRIWDSKTFHLIECHVSDSKPTVLNNSPEKRILLVLLRSALLKMFSRVFEFCFFVIISVFRWLIIFSMMLRVNRAVNLGILLEQHQSGARVLAQNGVRNRSVARLVNCVDVGSFLKFQKSCFLLPTFAFWNLAVLVHILHIIS